MVTKIISLFCLFFLASCGSHLIINPEQCESTGMWGRPQIIESIDKETYKFEFEESIWTPFGFAKPTQIYLRDFIEDHHLLCSRIDSLQVDFKTKWYEGILRFIPFMSRKTVVISGLYKPESFTDEE